MKRIIQTWLIRGWICMAIACLAMGSQVQATEADAKAFASSVRGPDYFAGGSRYYSFGTSQSRANFENVERAQSEYGFYKTQRHWTDIKPMRSPGEFNMLQAYYPLSVRWKLKDGREFILDRVDIRPYMKEYFKTHDVELPWQKERRPKAKSGDGDPSLVHEIKDDGVILKWLITTNHVPVDERFKPSGEANRWKFSDEEHYITTIPGQPTSGIDFDKHWEFANGDKQ